MAPRRTASSTPSKRTKNVPTTVVEDSTPSTPVSKSETKKSVTVVKSTSNEHQHYEFGGPYLGPIGIMIGLPLISFLYTAYCGGNHGWYSLSTIWETVQTVIQQPNLLVSAIQNTWNTEVFIVYVTYFIFQVILYLTLPGTMQQGTLLSNNKRLTYPMNGLLSLFITVLTIHTIDTLKLFGGNYGWLWIYNNWSQLIMATIVFSFLLSIFLYWYSFQDSSSSDKLIAEGCRNIPLYDFFLGRELNPRIINNQLDLKFFCELRPGLVMWLLINIACLMKQFSVHTSVDPWMVFVVLFEGYYVLDSVLNEGAILTTMDITTDGFGFMLAFGDLAWVPSVYSLQARFLAEQYSPLKTGQDYLTFAAVVFMGMLGMYIFRSANSQKDLFKRNPNDPAVAKLPTIQTKRGTKLIAGGWWGLARHINYFGDWLMAVSWSAATGISTPLTYFYPFYFAILLIHRDGRDEEKCEAKYGDSWKEYCKIAKYRIVPYVY